MIRKFTSLFRKPGLMFLVLLITFGVGYIVWHSTNKDNKTTTLAAQYISFDGSYLFTIPANYTASETVIDGATIVYPEVSPPTSGQKLESLYANGVVAIQPIVALKDNNPDNFKQYMEGQLSSDLKNSLNSKTDIKESTQNGIQETKVLAQTQDGKLLRVVYGLNQSQPVLMVASDESDVLKAVSSTMEDLKKMKNKPDIDQAAQVAKTAAEMLQKQDVAGLKKNGTTQFNESESKDKLTADLKLSAAFLKRSITIVGGAYNGKNFNAQFIIAPIKSGDQPTSGILSLQKVGKTWKLNGFQLPK